MTTKQPEEPKRAIPPESPTDRERAMPEEQPIETERPHPFDPFQAITWVLVGGWIGALTTLATEQPILTFAALGAAIGTATYIAKTTLEHRYPDTNWTARFFATAAGLVYGLFNPAPYLPTPYAEILGVLAGGIFGLLGFIWLIEHQGFPGASR